MGEPHLQFLVIAPLGRDAELLCALLSRSGISARCAGSLRHLEQSDGALLAGLLLTDEALNGDGAAVLRAQLRRPEWSELPTLLLTSSAHDPRQAAVVGHLRQEFANLIPLERPIGKDLLLSVVQGAYRARVKQVEARAAEARQQQSDQALRDAEKLATAGRLAATMAHEVNNPLEAVSNLLYLIEVSQSLEEARSLSQLAARELRRVSEIVDHTLRFHRAPSKPEVTDVAELACSALALFRGRLRVQQIEESVFARKSLAHCSPGELRQALVNLIANAVDAMPSGGTLCLRVHPLHRQEAVRIVVADTGGGIPEDVRDRLFAQFFTTKGAKGTGIGLWLTREIIERNGGRLQFRSRTGSPSGTVFAITLPKAAHPELAPRAA